MLILKKTFIFSCLFKEDFLRVHHIWLNNFTCRALARTQGLEKRSLRLEHENFTWPRMVGLELGWLYWSNWWARQGLNLWPHACEACALPLSYVPLRGAFILLPRACVVNQLGTFLGLLPLLKKSKTSFQFWIIGNPLLVQVSKTRGLWTSRKTT